MQKKCESNLLQRLGHLLRHLVNFHLHLKRLNRRPTRHNTTSSQFILDSLDIALKLAKCRLQLLVLFLGNLLVLVILRVKQS